MVFPKLADPQCCLWSICKNRSFRCEDSDLVDLGQSQKSAYFEKSPKRFGWLADVGVMTLPCLCHSNLTFAQRQLSSPRPEHLLGLSHQLFFPFSKAGDLLPSAPHPTHPSIVRCGYPLEHHNGTEGIDINRNIEPLIFFYVCLVERIGIMSIGPKESKSKEGFYKELQVCKQMYYRSVLHSMG